MNPRQSVITAMFLSVVVYMLANAKATSIQAQITNLKQVPASSTVATKPGFGGGSGNGGGGAGGGL